MQSAHRLNDDGNGGIAFDILKPGGEPVGKRAVGKAAQIQNTPYGDRLPGLARNDRGVFGEYLRHAGTDNAVSHYGHIQHG